MPIDFTLTPEQRGLQREARKFAQEVLASATAAELLATPEERFLATKPIYEAAAIWASGGGSCTRCSCGATMTRLPHVAQPDVKQAVSSKRAAGD